jgi:hypothetical protein
MTTIDQTAVPTLPSEIARAVVLPASYGDLDGVVFPACDWLRENAPIARAEVDGYDPVWLIASTPTSKRCSVARTATGWPCSTPAAIG